MNLTPAMKQFYEMKEQYPDCMLFFRMWDFYEMFDNDALIANKVLGIAVTTRNKNASNPTPLAGIPFHAKEKYLPLLIQAGYKVAIAEQVSDPKLKGIVQREVVRVVTPATLGLEKEWFENDNANILSLCETNGVYGLSILQLGKNNWKTCEFQSFNELQTELFKLAPKEVVLEKELFSNSEIKDTLEKKYSMNIYYFTAKKDAYKNLVSHFWTTNLSGFGIEKYTEAIRASNLLLEYLEENQKENFSFLDSIRYFDTQEIMQLDEATIRNLDLVYNFATKSQKEGTLFGILDATKTKMGKELLYQNILEPLHKQEQIQERQSFVEEFLQQPMLLDKVRTKLTCIANIQNILNRIALNRATPKDLLQLKTSLISIVEIIEIIKTDGSKKMQKIITPASL